MDKNINVFIPSPWDSSKTTRYPMCTYCGQEIRPDWYGNTTIYVANGKTMCRRCYKINYGKFNEANDE